MRTDFPVIEQAISFASLSERDVLSIAAYLLYARGDPDQARYWNAYFNMAPRNVHLAVNFSMPELSAAKGSMALLRMVTLPSIHTTVPFVDSSLLPEPRT